MSDEKLDDEYLGEVSEQAEGRELTLDELLPALAVPVLAADAVDSAAGAAASAVIGGPLAAVMSDKPRLLKINEILDKKVRSALTDDGGWLEVMGLKDHTLTIKYQAACGVVRTRCPPR